MQITLYSLQTKLAPIPVGYGIRPLPTLPNESWIKTVSATIWVMLKRLIGKC